MFLFTDLRRKRLRSMPLPAGWLSLLEEVPLYRRLPPADREELHGHMRVLTSEKHFEGGGGFTVSDGVLVTIAAQACVLLLHRRTDYYPGLSSIIVYPGEFLAPYHDVDAYGVVSEGIDCRSGESGPGGTLVLSWEDITAEGLDVHAGYNVVLHEFAHQLDVEESLTSLGPPLPPPDRGEWLRILERDYLRLKRDAAHGRATVLDPYGAESLVEFFAVATECFFERPIPLRNRHPELYGALAGYYRQDPVSWPAPLT